MRRFLRAAVLLMAPLGAPLAALAQQPALSVEALRDAFGQQEQIILDGVLTDASQARAFAQDARNSGATAEVLSRWRARLAYHSQDYLGREHPVRTGVTTLKQMVEAAEWASLMTALRMLGKGGLTDQAKLKIFVTMMENAESDLKAGDTEGALNVIKTARGMFRDAMREYLATPEAQQALRDDQRRRQEEERRWQEEERRQEEERERQQAVVPKPISRRPATVPAATQPTKALDQAKDAAEQGGQASRSASSEDAAARSGRGFEGRGEDQGSGPVDARQESSGSLPAESKLTPPGDVKDRRPALTVAPPAPESDGSADMAELRSMKDKVKGKKALLAAGGGAVLGGLLGFLVGSLLGGPLVGALVGAAVAGAGGYALGKKLWG